MTVIAPALSPAPTAQAAAAHAGAARLARRRPAPVARAQRPDLVARPTQPVLADDAQLRPTVDRHQPVSVLVEPLLAGLGDHGTPAALVGAAASTGLLDVGVDETLGHVNGYAPPAAQADLGPALARLAAADAAAAATLAAQRRSIDLLASGRRTAANDRLLRALRRGWAVGSHPQDDDRPVSGERRSDGSVVVARAQVTVTAAGPGAALVLPIAVGEGHVVVAWVGLGSRGTSLIPPSDATGTTTGMTTHTTPDATNPTVPTGTQPASTGMTSTGTTSGVTTVLLRDVVFPADVIIAEAGNATVAGGAEEATAARERLVSAA